MKRPGSHVGLSFLVDGLFVIQQDFDGFDIFFGNGVQEGVFSFYSVLDEQFHHLQVLVVDGHQKTGPTQRIHAVDVDIARVPGPLHHSASTGHSNIQSDSLTCHTHPHTAQTVIDPPMDLSTGIFHLHQQFSCPRRPVHLAKPFFFALKARISIDVFRLQDGKLDRD